ncbi:MAG: septum formation protein Maf [Thermoflexales bacterium]|nr:septum formation protein Maf [Thermoflexales bacterium]
MTSPPLILASGSPRRKELLVRLGLPFTVALSGVAEECADGLSPLELVQTLACTKAKAVAATLTEGLVIGADTIGALDGLILGKPLDEDDARRMLRMLAGRPHQVISGIAVVDAAGKRLETGTVTTQVTMRAYTGREIDEYVASGEVMDKAAAYAIQGLGAALVERVEGCYNNVVGFPLCEVAALLSRFGLTASVPGPVCTQPDGRACPRLRRNV